MKILLGFVVLLLYTPVAMADVASAGYVDMIISALRDDVNNKANNADVVHIAGDETISGIKTFIEPVVINSEKAGSPIMTLTGTGTTIYFNLVRTGGSEAVLEAGQSVGLFGTKNNYPVEIRTNYQPRIRIGTEGDVVLMVAPPQNSNDNQVATTAWVNERIKAVCAVQ